MTTLQLRRALPHFLFTHALVLTALALLFGIASALWFLYLFFYQPLREVPSLYTLQTDTAATRLDSKTIEAAHAAAITKQRRQWPSLQNIASPF